MPVRRPTRKEQLLQRKIRELEIRLAETEETLRAIREGEVDAVVVRGRKGEQIYSLGGVDASYRRIVETMSEAALTVSIEGVILLANAQFGDLVDRPLEEMVGHLLLEFVAPTDKVAASALLDAARAGPVKQRLLFDTATGTAVPVRVSANILTEPDALSICVVATDLTELEGSTRLLQQLRRQQEELQAVNEELAAMQEELRLQNEELAASRDDLDLARARYQDLFQSAPDGYIVTDESGLIIEINRVAAGLLGLQSIKSPGFPFFALLPPAAKPEVHRLVSALVHGEVSSATCEVQLSPDGDTTSWVGISAAGSFDGNGNVNEVRWLLRDITNRRQAELALRASEDLLRAVTDNSPDAIYVKDRESRWLMANPAVLRIVGRTADEALGKSDLDLYADPRIGRAILENDRRILERGQAEAIEEVADTTEGRRTFLSIKAPRRNPGGEIIGIVGISRDITEQKRAEMALRESEERFRSLFENSMDAVFLTAADGRVLAANPAACAMFDMSEAELRQVGPQGIIDSEDPRYAVAIEERGRTGRMSRVEFNYVRKNGERFPAEVDSVIVDGDPPYSFVILRDVTERKRSEQALQTANDALEVRVKERTSQLRALSAQLTWIEQRERRRIAMILHDHLQQILVAAKFRASILSGARSGDEVGAGVKEVKRLLDDAIGASRTLTAELSPPVLHGAGLRPGLSWLASWMAQKHGLSVDLCMEEDLPQIPEELAILLFESTRELLFNAVKHAKVSLATVSLRRVEGNAMQITVSDAGSGFDPSRLNRIGEPGAGWGLFNVRERLNLIGGRVEIESAPGKGSRFILTCPLGKESFVTSAATAEESLT